MGCPLFIIKKTISGISVATDDHQSVCDFSGTGKLKGS